LLLAASATALDVDGKWWGDMVSDGGSQPLYVTLIQQGTTLKGTGGPSPTDQDLLTGKIEGTRIIFDVTRAGRTPLHFELSSNSAGLAGIVQARHNGQTVTAKVSLRKRST
jgi:hypothetical protein